MNVIVRPMQQEDIDSVYAIELAGHIAPWSRDILSDCVLVEYDCRVLELTERDSKQVVGYMISRHSDNVCHLLNICIAPSKQGQGYGKLLLKSLTDSHHQLAFGAIILEVRPSNIVAIHLYEALGFEKDSIKKDYYTDENGVEDALFLKKIFEP